jgi:acyl-CoA dehydrogenase
MAIDFRLDPEVLVARDRIRTFFEKELIPTTEQLIAGRNQAAWRPALQELREKAKREKIWAPHMPKEWGGMGLSHMEMAFVSAECGRHRFGAYVLNCQAPDEGNMHTMLHFATPEQKAKYMKPLVDGEVRSCFAMTEPGVASSDPTGLRTYAVQQGDKWIINGHKWFITGARGAKFAIVIARTDPDANPPQARNTAFIVDIDENPGFQIVRDIETMAGKGNHCEIRLENVVVPDANILGGRGQGHRLGQVRLGPARLAHCMRWIGQAETALDMLVKRATTRELHGGVLADKQLIQQMMSESALEIYQSKLMTLHAAYLIDKGLPFRNEVSMTKHHVANTLWKVVDRAIQVHGALGYSTDTPLADMLVHARSARLVDGADEVHLSQIARAVLDAYATEGSVRQAMGRDLL